MHEVRMMESAWSVHFPNNNKNNNPLQVRGKDNVGATMDSMELERQRGITIQVSHRLPR